MIERGKLIAIYGANEETVSMQVNALTNEIRLHKPWKFVHQVNYSDDSLHNLTQRIINCRQILSGMLNNGINVITSNYIGRSIAVGRLEGISVDGLDNLVEILEKPEVSILIDEPRSEIKMREAYLFTAAIYGWEVLRADDSDIDKKVYKIAGKVL